MASPGGFSSTLRAYQLGIDKAIDPDGVIAQAIPTRRVVGCVLYVAASVEEPGPFATIATADFSSVSLTTS